MTLEKRSASQVVTFEPEQLQWTYPILTSGTASASATYAQGFAGDTFIVMGSLSAGSLIAPGDKFQLYTGTSLKETTVFTVAGITPSTGYSSWNIFFTPAPQVLPTTSDTGTSLTAPKYPRWLGAIGHVSGVNYSFSCPGGPDQFTCLFQIPPDYRTDAMNPGRRVQVWRGASCVWEGKMDEPTPAQAGWTLTAHGIGAPEGEDFTAFWTTWNADNPVNRAISRGLRWNNPGIGTPSGIYLGQVQDPASMSVTAFLNLLCTGGGLLWQVNPGIASTLPAAPWVLSVFEFPIQSNGNPTAPPSRILVSSAPVPRTVVADINTILLRYQATADIAATTTKAAVAATYGTIAARNVESITAHGPMEYFLDLSSAGVMSSAAAVAIGNNVLQKYIRASWGGAFTVGPGQLLNAGGYPVDLGCETAGTIMQLMVTDGPYGGEVAAAPLTFLVGEYQFDDDSDTAVITPFQSVRTDMSSLIGALYPGKFS
jgi:hypothetical protein